MYVYMYVGRYVCRSMYVYVGSMYVCRGIMCICMYVYMYVGTDVCMYVCMYGHVCMCVCMYVLVYVYPQQMKTKLGFGLLLRIL